MSVPTSRATLIDYCKRKLGAPVLEVNVDDDQVEDRVDEALQFYQEYHSDAVFKTYLKHQITNTDVTNGYLTLNDAVISVQRILPLSAENSSINMFDVKYQMHFNDMYNLGFQGNLSNFAMTKSYMSTLDMVMNGPDMVRFNRHMNKLFLDIDWEEEGTVGKFVIVDAYRIVDVSSYADVYNDMFLKRYTTALIKQQWGANLLKFDQVLLPGGVMLNGRQIYDDATGEIGAIEEEMQLKYEMPPEFFTG